jgi:hypothetical protein
MDPVGRAAGAVLVRAGAEVDGAGCGSARYGSVTRASRERRGSWQHRRARAEGVAVEGSCARCGNTMASTLTSPW